jgi:hypothetical protein
MSVDQIFKIPYFKKIIRRSIDDIGKMKNLAIPIDIKHSKIEEKEVNEKTG